MVVILEAREEFPVLVIDGQRPFLDLMREVLAELPLRLLTASYPEGGLQLVKQERPQLVLLDIDLHETPGMEVLRDIVAIDPRTEVILTSADFSPAEAVQAIRAGAADCLSKPIDIGALRERVEQRIHEAERNRQTSKLDAELLSSFKFHGLIGRSPSMLDLFNLAMRTAPHYRSALISGASGTGKELLARALHDLSPARNHAFVVCNCAGIPESLAESELFGYVKGAFTGADQDRIGLFEQADGGTVFLDEIGEMPISMQAKLLRVLQTHEVQPVGSHKPRKLNIRVIAATNRDLRAHVHEKLFREDLFYRLSPVHLQVPALAERKQDLPLLQRHFLEKYAKEYGKKLAGISRRAQTLLSRHHWPGNVRELENMISGAVMKCDGPALDIQDFPAELQRQEGNPPSSGLSLKVMQQEHAARVLKLVDGNKAKAAQILGISRSTLYNILAGKSEQLG